MWYPRERARLFCQNVLNMHEIFNVRENWVLPTIIIKIVVVGWVVEGLFDGNNNMKKINYQIFAAAKWKHVLQIQTLGSRSEMWK